MKRFAELVGFAILVLVFIIALTISQQGAANGDPCATSTPEAFPTDTPAANVYMPLLRIDATVTPIPPTSTPEEPPL